MSARTEREVGRLRDAMVWSAKKAEPFRRSYLRQLKNYVGPHYGIGGEADVVINLFKLAIDTYQRQLSANCPRVLVLTNNQGLKTVGYELEIALNHFLKQIDFGSTLKATVKTSLMAMGIMKIGLTSREEGEGVGYNHDAGMPFADQVLFEDWLHDMAARVRQEWSWCGNRYNVPLEDVLSNPRFDAKVRNKLKNHTSGEGSTLESMNERSWQLSQGHSVANDEYEPHIDIWDIYFPRDGRILTFVDKNETDVLQEVEWEGVEDGPYPTLSLCDVPGNVMSTPPGAHLLDMHLLINRLFIKAADQAERQKQLAFASGVAAMDGTAEAIMDAVDGQVLRVDNPDAVRDIVFGGAPPETLGLLEWLKSMYSYIGGNIEVMSGLTQGGDTLGQERLLKASSSQLVNEYQDIVLSYTKKVVKSLGYYFYSDPFLEVPLEKIIQGANVTVPFNWGPERRQADYYEFLLDIEPYSLQPRSPAERIETLMMLATQVFLPLQPMLQQEGGRIKWDEFLSYIARYTDLPELGDLIEFAGMPLDMKGQLGQSRPIQSPITTRQHIRRDAGGGGNDQAAMMQALMSGKQPGQQPA